MNTMKWLLRRELWEHRGGFVWAPAILGSLMVLGTALTAIAALAMGSKHGINIDGVQVTNLGRFVDDAQKAHIVESVSHGYVAFSMPLFLVMTIAVFFFCLGSLFDERKDKSVLFWKSLPVSDAQTVISKAAMALLGAPLITLAIGVAASLVILLTSLVLAAFGGLNLFGVLITPATYLAPLQLLALIPVYLLWALPTVGWLMMVSAWARTKPFLWAVGAPVLAGVLISWFNAMFDFDWNVQWFWAHVVGRGLGSVVPGIWFAFTDVGQHIADRQEEGKAFAKLVGASWQVLGTANLWIGALLGSAMIAAAVRLRRWRDEG